MIRYTLSLLSLLLFFSCENAAQSSDSRENSSSSDAISGRLEVTIEGKEYVYTDFKKNLSRLTFQDKGLAILIDVSDSINISAALSARDFYEKDAYVFQVGQQNQTSEQNKNILATSFRFRHPGYDRLSLDEGLITIESYDIESGELKMTFEGIDKPSSFSPKGPSESVKFKGNLMLKGARSTDRRD